MDGNIKDTIHDSTKFNIKNIQCANCGDTGHIVKDCKKPITSFGIIAFKIVKNESEEKNDKNVYLSNLVKNAKESNYPKVKFLMIQRKDTMGYIDFVRGKYTDNEYDKHVKLKIYLNEMTFNEKSNLLNQTFDEIWNNLWINHESKCYLNEYESAKRKFSQLNIKSLVAQSETIYTFQEFGFPKGRRNMREQNVVCAKREFFEESGYDSSTYQFIKDHPLVQEEFVGTNNVRYRHTYYLVKMNDNVRPPIVDTTNKIQTGEVRNIGWFTYEESMLLLRPYDVIKKSVLTDVYKDIQNMNLKFNCSLFPTYKRQEYWRPRQRQQYTYFNVKRKYTNSDEYLIDTL